MTIRTTRRSIAVAPLDGGHVSAAALLVTQRVARLRASVPALPEAWTRPDRIAATLHRLVEDGEGAVALEGDELVAFQGAVRIDGHGGRWAYTADVAHGAAGPGARAAVEALYAHLAARWVREACLEHVITVLAGEEEVLAAFTQLGFGATTVDLVRDLEPVAAGLPAGVTVRQATVEDAGPVARLDEGLRAHLAASPVFLVLGAPRPPEILRRRLADDAEATFLAEVAREPVAFLRIGPSASDVATIVRDRGTASITGALTAADRRGEGIAAALLDAALAWARGRGYERCGVDHESANLEAARFWRRHFAPVAYSLTRRLPPRLAR